MNRLHHSGTHGCVLVITTEQLRDKWGLARVRHNSVGSIT